MFFSLSEALDKLQSNKAEKLKRITEGVSKSSLVNVKVDTESGSIRYLDSKDGSLLIEVSNALDLK